MNHVDVMKEKSNKDNISIYALIVLFCLVVLACIERTYGIDRQSLWSDELYAVIASYKPFLGGAWKMMLSDSHPPGYLSFMYVTLPITGYSDFGVRAHALIFGILWIPLVFHLCYRWFSLPIALLVVAVVASSYNAVYYSQEARAYTMLIAFSLVNIICLFEILFSDEYGRKHSIGFVISSVIILYLHYSGFVLICTEVLLCGALWMFGYRKVRPSVLVLLFVAPMLIYSPWLGIMYKNLVDAPSQWAVSASPSVEEVRSVLQRLAGVSEKSVSYHYAAIFGVLLYIVIKYFKKEFSRDIVVICSLFFIMVVPIVAFFIKSLVDTPIFVERYFLLSGVIWSILLGYAIGKIVLMVGKRLESIAVVSVIVLYSYLAIKGNISQELYSRNNKIPMREAVSLVRGDIKSYSPVEYAILTSHRGFDHYLKVQHVEYDDKWQGRRYLVPQGVGAVKEYLEKKPSVKYLYYLVVREDDTENALVPLKMQYKLLSQQTLPFDHDAGHVDVYKFNVKERPDKQQLGSVGTNTVNDFAQLIAQDVAAKDPSTYYVLLTHKWMSPYLLYNGIDVDHGWSQHQFLAAIQADGVFDYINAHPAIKNIYYLALQEKPTEGAELMLQLRYQLVSEKTMDSSIGKISLLKYDTKLPPIVGQDAETRMKAEPIYRLIEWLKQNTDQSNPEKNGFAFTHQWIDLYLKRGLGGSALLSQRYADPALAASLFAYVDGHPTIERLYYVALREPQVESAVHALTGKYQLVSKTDFEIVGGTIDVYVFNVVR